MIKKIGLVFFIFLHMSTAAAFESDISKGYEVYLQKCMGCHGESGDGRLPGQPNFNKGDAFNKSDSALFDIVREGRGVMPSFGGLLSDEEIHNVVAYIKSFL